MREVGRRSAITEPFSSVVRGVEFKECCARTRNRIARMVLDPDVQQAARAALVVAVVLAGLGAKQTTVGQVASKKRIRERRTTLGRMLVLERREGEVGKTRGGTMICRTLDVRVTLVEGLAMLVWRGYLSLE